MMTALPLLVIAGLVLLLNGWRFDWSSLCLGGMAGYAFYRIVWAPGIYHDARLLSEALAENARLTAENAEVYRELGRGARAA